MVERIASRCVCCGAADLARSPAVLMPFVAYRAFGWTPVEITPEWGLRSLKPGMAYPLCSSLQCQACGLLFLDIRFSDSELAALYAGYRGPDYAAQREEFEPGYAALNAQMLAATPDTRRAEAFLRPLVGSAPLNVLDFGGDTGANTPLATGAATVDIFDISDRPVAPPARRVDRAQLRLARYDLVILSHVLEHAPAPAAVVREAAACLEDGAVLYVEVPYEAVVAQAPDSRDLAVAKRYWHEHVNFFTEPALRALAASCGLEVVALHARPMDSLANISQVLAMACRRERP